MKKLLLFFVLSFFYSNNVFALNWTTIMEGVTDSNGVAQDVYYNKTKMIKEGNFLTLWVLLDFHKKTNGAKSSMILQTIECGPSKYSTERFKLWRNISFDKSMAKGKTTYDSGEPKEDTPWRKVGPKNNTLIHIIINYICDNER